MRDSLHIDITKETHQERRNIDFLPQFPLQAARKETARSAAVWRRAGAACAAPATTRPRPCHHPPATKQHNNNRVFPCCNSPGWRYGCSTAVPAVCVREARSADAVVEVCPAECRQRMAAKMDGPPPPLSLPLSRSLGTFSFSFLTGFLCGSNVSRPTALFSALSLE